jgi:predicted dehydrogenase
MAEKLRVAVIGVGHLGKEHARVYAGLPETELVAVADTDEKQGREVARKWKTQWADDYRHLLGRIDAASIAVPTEHHHAIARELIEAGVHCLIEKPMTDSSATARELCDLAREKGVALQVGHIERFNPVMKAFQEYGVRPLFIEAHRLSPFSFRSIDIGVTLDLMIHDLDIILHLVGSPLESVDACGIPVISESYEDIANARLTFENGCVANVTASRVSLKKMRKIRVFSSDCYASLDYMRRKGILYKKSPDLKLQDLPIGKGLVRTLADMVGYDFRGLLKIEKIKLDDYEPLAAELESFTQAVLSGSTPPVTGEDALRAIVAAEQIVESVRAHLDRARVYRMAHGD